MWLHLQNCLIDVLYFTYVFLRSGELITVRIMSYKLSIHFSRTNVEEVVPACKNDDYERKEALELCSELNFAAYAIKCVLM